MDILFGYGVAFVFGLVIGVVIFWFYSMGSDSGKAAEELESLKEEHTAYRSKVDTHFQETAELFKDLTDRYRDVYKHMANGADSLCSEEVKKLQSELGTSNLLIDAEPVEAAPETPKKEQAEPQAKPADAAPEAKKEAKPEAAAPVAEEAADPTQPKDHAPPRTDAAKGAKEAKDKPKKSEAKKASADDEGDDLPLASEVEVHPELRAQTQKTTAEPNGVKIH